MTTTPYQLKAVGDSAVRNLIINGNMDFWQRGTSFTEVSNNQLWTADRWMIQNTLATNVTVTQSTDVPTQTQSGYLSRYSLLLTNATGSASTTDYVNIQYRMEGQDYQALHARKVRVQFWTKSSVTGTFGVSFGNGSANRTYVTTFTVNSANTWEKKTIDLQLDTTGTWAIDNTMGLRMYIHLMVANASQTSTLNSWQAASISGPNTQTNWAATTGATFQLAQVMLIPGNFDSGLDIPFTRAGRSIGHELQMAQRYYEKSYDVGTTPGTAPNELGCFLTIAQSTTNLFNRVVIPYKVGKRATAPTITLYNANTGATGGVFNRTSGGNLTGGSTTDASEYSATLSYTTGTTTVGDSLEWHFTIESEL